MEAIIEILKDIPKNYVTAILTNWVVIFIVHFIFWVKFKSKFQKFRIQLNERVDSAQIKRELINSLFVFFVGAIFASLVYYFSTKGYNKVYTNFSDHPFYSVFGIVILLIIDDTWFYWTHRLLHHPKLYKYVHFEHHKSVDVNPFTSMSFHIVESLLLTLYLIPLSFIMPLYIPVLGFMQLYGLFDNIKAHLGYEFFPKWWNKNIGKVLTSSTHHNMHHSKFMGNYGLHFRFWDKLMGTEFDNYEKEFDAVKNRE
jgi:sterol desaturase/sphingolipid hydroxylase (fatty acid hydroxylase superfamily)